MNLIPRLLFTKALWDAPQAWCGQPHLPWTLQGELHHWLPQSCPTWDCLISLWKQESWQALSSLMLRVGEVEQASVERLNNCINMASSQRTHAHSAESRGRELLCKAASYLPMSCPNSLYTRLHFPRKVSFINQACNKRCFLTQILSKLCPFSFVSHISVYFHVIASNDFLVCWHIFLCFIFFLPGCETHLDKSIIAISQIIIGFIYYFFFKKVVSQLCDFNS